MQTVFEDVERNTFDRARANQQRFDGFRLNADAVISALQAHAND